MIHRILILFLILCPGLAFAEIASGPFSPPDTDISMQILNAMFGQLGAFGDSSSDAFSKVMLIFNQAVLMIGGILATYTILAGTIGTAHDGEMMGKKFSSVWIPIRYSIGTALILPVINGYSVINYLVAWAIVQGAGLADIVWKEYVSNGNLQQQMSVGISQPDAMKMGYNTFSSLVCMRGYEAVLTGMKDNKVENVLIGNTSPTAAISSYSNGTKTVMQFGFTNGSANLTPSTCGRLDINDTENPTYANTDTQSGGNSSFTDGGMFGDRRLIWSSANTIAKQNKEATTVMVNKLDAIAVKFVNSALKGTPTYDDSEVVKVIQEYQETRRKNAAVLISQYSNFKEIQDSANKDGWAFAGAFYMKISYLMDMASRTASSIPEATGPTETVQKVFGEHYYNSIAKPLNEFIKDNNHAGYAINSIQGGVDDDDWHWWDINVLLKKAISGTTSYVFDDNSNPVLEMKRLGNWCFNAGAGLITAYAGGVVLWSEVPSQGTTATAAAVALLPVMLFFVPILMGVGFTLGYVLPMMPFFMWVGALLGWIVMCVEAIVISSLWMAMHLHPNGDDLTGKGANGYSLLLSLLLRPVFSVLGLIASINIIYVLGSVINKIYGSVFLLAQSDAGFFTLLFGMITAPLIYLGLMWTVVRKCFSITHSISDELLKWFGGNGSMLGREAESIGGQNAGAYAAGLGAGKAAQGSMRAMKDGKEMADNKQKIQGAKEDAFDRGITQIGNTYGNDVADKKSAALGIKSAKDYGSHTNQRVSAAYDEGLKLSSQYGGDAGSAAFADKMLEASNNNYREYDGDKIKASGAIANSVAIDSLNSKASQNFGDNGASYLASQGSKNGQQLLGKTAEAYNELSKLKEESSPTTFNSSLAGAVDANQSLSNYLAERYTGGVNDTNVDAGSVNPTNNNSSINPSELDIPNINFNDDGSVSVGNNTIEQQEPIQSNQLDMFEQQSTQTNFNDTQPKNSDERDW